MCHCLTTAGLRPVPEADEMADNVTTVTHKKQGLPKCNLYYNCPSCHLSANPPIFPTFSPRFSVALCGVIFRAFPVLCPSLARRFRGQPQPLLFRCSPAVFICFQYMRCPPVFRLRYRLLTAKYSQLFRLLPACCPFVNGRSLRCGRFFILSLFLLCFAFVFPLFFGNDPTANRHPIPPEYKPVKPPEMPYNTTRPKNRKHAQNATQYHPKTPRNTTRFYCPENTQ